jgi:hypothetical protein
MKFTKKVKNEYKLNILTFILLAAVAAGMIGIGLFEQHQTSVIFGIIIFAISLLIPLLSTTRLILKAMRIDRKRIIRKTKNKPQVDKTISNEKA